MKSGLHTTRRLRVSACWPHQHALRLFSLFPRCVHILTLRHPSFLLRRHCCGSNGWLCGNARQAPGTTLLAPARMQRAHWVRCGGKPNPSLNPRLATAGTVSRAGASTTIVAVPAYSLPPLAGLARTLGVTHIY